MVNVISSDQIRYTRDDMTPEEVFGAFLVERGITNPKRLLLINLVQVPEKWFDPEVASLGRYHIYPPTGLLYIAASARLVKPELDVRILDLNFEMLRRLTQQFIPKMREQQWGRIINITGTSEPGAVNIASSAKAAVHAWAKGLSRVLAPDGITINCLPPGRINSEQILNKVHPDPEERQAFIEANIPAGYFGEPEDMAHLIAFLCSPLARYITGEVIHVDGGMRRFAF